jgi:FtsH-binding integral membrane protein
MVRSTSTAPHVSLDKMLSNLSVTTFHKVTEGIFLCLVGLFVASLCLYSPILVCMCSQFQTVSCVIKIIIDSSTTLYQLQRLYRGISQSVSQSVRVSQSYFTTGGLPPISLSWRRAP